MTDTSRAAPASFEVRRPSRATLVIEIPGEVTARSEPLLTRAFEQASDQATGTVALDFTRLGYMNSGGIGLLVTLLVRTVSDNGSSRSGSTSTTARSSR